MIEICSKSKAPFIDIVCGKCQEIFSSPNIDFAITTVNEKTSLHKHLRTEELYYILKGKGKITTGKKSASIQECDLVSIPLEEFHILENMPSTPIELIVISHPALDPSDIIEEHWF